MKRGRGLQQNPGKAAERARRRQARRMAEGPRPEDLAREARRTARQTHESGRSPENPDAKRAWDAAASRAGCALCADDPPSADVARERGFDLARVEGHHCIPKQDLKRWGLHALLWDVRNQLAVCRYHHDRHEYTPGARIPRRLLPASAFAFADEIGARYVLDDDDVYPAPCCRYTGGTGACGCTSGP